MMTVPGLTGLELVGRGGNARVYRAYQPDLDRFVAVKIIEGASEAIRRGFDRERKAMGRLSQHPGIVTIFESGFTDQGEPYLTMPYLDGGSLQDRIDQKGPLTLPEALQTLLDIGVAVSYAHSQGILHCDIKPGNVLIDDLGRPQVADFGIARLAGGRTQTSRDINLTPAFGPPELLGAQSPSEASDVYSLAATFSCLITGRPPFVTGDPNMDTFVGISGRVLTEPPPDLKQFDVPIDIAEAVERAMSKAQSDRPQSVHAFVGTLGLVPEELTATLRRSSPVRRSEHVTASSDQPPTRDHKRGSLPIQLTSFIGRDQEVAEVTKLVRGARLVSVLGPGGAGKTRLALRVAETMAAEFTHGARLIPLAHLNEAELLTAHFAGAMDLLEIMQGSPHSALEAYLRDRDVLIVLDNCEHLAEPVSVLTTRLMRASPGLRVLVTSRKPLSVDGEVIYTLRPMDLTSEAVRLFLERAEASRPDFRASEGSPMIQQICQTLDGLPLAIELAAARIRFLPPEAIAERLDRRFELLTGGSRTEFPHHETLKAALDWSHDLLTNDQRLVFRRLSVFRGGTSARLIDSFIEDIDSVLHALFALADQSLVQIHDGRFSMLETVREYAHEKLADAGEESATNRAHAGLFANLVEVEGNRILTSSQVDSITRIGAEYDNVRAALAWCFDHDPLLGARMTSSLGDFWFIRGHASEGRRWLVQALAVGVDTELEAKLHLALSQLAWAQVDYDQAAESADRATEMATSLDDDLLMGVSLDLRARVAVLQNDFLLADRLLAMARDHLEKANATRWLGDCYQFLGIAARFQGRFDEAAALHQRAKELFLTSGDIHGAAWATAAEARATYYVTGDLDQLADGTRSAIEFAQQVGDRRAISNFKSGLAHYLSLSSVDADQGESAREVIVQLYLEALPELIDIGDLRRLTEHLGGTVPIIIQLDRPEAGAEVHGAVLQAQQELGVPDLDRESLEAIESALQSAVGPNWVEVVDRGRKLGIIEAAQTALDILL